MFKYFWVVARDDPNDTPSPADVSFPETVLDGKGGSWHRPGGVYFCGNDYELPLADYDVLGPVVIPTRAEILAASEVVADAA